ncbi:MAG: DUF3309 family protein [Gammaproteobacteria bacterium]|nr:DUF3309 family protein [Gammaproteobacteria bacterium]
METLMLILLLMLLLGTSPALPHGTYWDYRPSNALSVILIAGLLWVLTGYV